MRPGAHAGSVLAGLCRRRPADRGGLFGRNLDAFWDAVEHQGPGWPGEVQLVFTNTAALAGLRTAGGGSLLDGLRRIAAEATRIAVRLA
ncbi:barstar family protein [Caulobacter sp. CCUG 60055]|uniref:barstar family protein n=1 Tax=Caulobacter sp. CCUG 60055 TaxID=2100090 RepID=UPI001FA7F6EB|nr:barstar family protein [Caulobacter sp. CCUG 60055]